MSDVDVSPILIAARISADSALRRFLEISSAVPPPSEAATKIALDELSAARVRVSRIEAFLAVFDGDHAIMSADDVERAFDAFDAALATAINDLRISLGI